MKRIYSEPLLTWEHMVELHSGTVTRVFLKTARERESQWWEIAGVQY